MKKRIALAIIAIILVSTLVVSTKHSFDSEITVLAEGPTSVGGILWDNTTWTLANSPYAITSTVQIPENVTLTIEPGVAVNTQINDYMFLLHGIIVAQGTVDEKIVFDGGNSASFFNAEGSTAESFLEMENCIVKNGKKFWWHGHGHFSLRNSEVSNLTGWSYIWYPQKDVLIDRNIFIDITGFETVHREANVTIQNNLFIGKNPEVIEEYSFIVSNLASYESSRTLVRFNSFLDMEGGVLDLVSGSSDAAMVAIENYWGTTNTSEIDSMIYDMNDDITCAGFIEYIPILTEPHPNTPVFSVTPEIHTFNISVETQDFNITVFSNSTISNFIFNQTLKELKFNVESLTGTTGFCNVSIPSDLMWGDFLLSMDDIPLTIDVDYTEIFNSTHYMFSIFYDHSVHTLRIVSFEVIPDLPSSLLMVLAIVVLSAGALVFRKKMLKNQN